MSIRPGHSFLNPEPVPETSTATWTPRFRSWKAFAISWERGRTVLDPSNLTVPASGPVADGVCLVQDAEMTTTETRSAQE